jgi:hypothetical protein
MGYDDDVDQALRAGIESVIGSELVDEDYDDVVDVVVMWWRDDDGDLVDGSSMPSARSPITASYG